LSFAQVQKSAQGYGKKGDRPKRRWSVGRFERWQGTTGKEEFQNGKNAPTPPVFS
jgi:hypothetical protein